MLYGFCQRGDLRKDLMRSQSWLQDPSLEWMDIRARKPALLSRFRSLKEVEGVNGLLMRQDEAKAQR
jgi:hypothetical protein